MDKKIADKVLYIMTLAMIRNSNGASVFVRYFGNCNTLSVKVFDRGWHWSYGQPAPVPDLDVSAVLDLDCDAELEKAIKHLEYMEVKQDVAV
jgi:hypothetical protein